MTAKLSNQMLLFQEVKEDVKKEVIKLKIKVKQ